MKRLFELFLGATLLASCASARAPAQSGETTTVTAGAPPRTDREATPSAASAPEALPVPASHPPLGEMWALDRADRICVRGGQLELTRSCTCGEPYACDVVATATGIDVRVARESASPSICDDCYPTSVRCARPALTCSQSLAITVNGAAALDVATGPECALTEGACWDIPPAP